ncbi:MAG: hypothetical protein WCE52_05050 [Candidatus Acidiferrum sp.]
MRSGLAQHARPANLALNCLAVLLFLLAIAPAYADIHPVPLEKNADSATCLECHSSDDNREFGGTGPLGPHGSTYPHILERNYQFSQAATPGGTVTNTFPNPDVSPQGPYAMCAKCHDLTNILSNMSWTQHSRHISQDGFSCSLCHTAHGMGASSGSVSGERLINFDISVVGQNAAAPISYNRATNTCTLVCHNATHNADGSVSVNGAVLPQEVTIRK